jgi:catechol 2,3-dioxygenase
MSTTTTSTGTRTGTYLPWTRPSQALLPDGMRLGPVRLAVTDLDRAVNFYTRVIGLAVASRGREQMPNGTHDTAHLSAGGEDVVVLQAEPGARPAGGKQGRHAGLYHVALNYPTRLELARVLRRIVEAGVRIGASDHATHEAIYLSDPDGNGLELAWDTPRERWPETLEEYMRVGRNPLDFDGLQALTADEPLVEHAAPGLRVGHLHLHVGDVARGRDFYVGLLGLELQFDAGTAAFTSAGGYHHHLGFNTWRGEGVPPVPAGVVGLREWRIELPTAADVDAARARLTAGGVPVTADGPDAFTTADPWGIPLRVGVDPAAR